jgi:hypothetical protein
LSRLSGRFWRLNRRRRSGWSLHGGRFLDRRRYALRRFNLDFGRVIFVAIAGPAGSSGRLFGVEAEMAPDRIGHVVIQRTRVRLLFGDA